MTSEQNSFASTLPQWVEDLLRTQQTLVLATSRNNVPYCSLMCFVPLAQERSLLLVTARNSVKFSNMQANEEVSLLLADKISFASGRPSGRVVTFLGRVSEVSPEERPRLESAFAAAFPGLASFVQDKSSALLRILLRSAIASEDVSRATRYPI